MLKNKVMQKTGYLDKNSVLKDRKKRKKEGRKE
jgi:hypothetical protein